MTPSLPDWLQYHADTTPERLALVAGAVEWSWSKLYCRTGETAARLAQAGVGYGDRVGVLLANGPEFVLVVHALMRLGAVLIPLNTRLTAPELGWQVEDAGIKLVLHDEPNAPRARMVTAAAGIPAISAQHVTETQGRGGKDTSRNVAVAHHRRGNTIHPVTPPRSRSIDLSAVHSIVYTSGTTGRPKGALLTFGNHWWSALGSAVNLGNHRHDRWLAVLPMFHVGGLAIIFRCAIYGTPMEIHSGFDAAVVNEAIDRRGVTLVSVVSNMLRRMLDEREGRPYPDSLRCVLLGGGPAPRPLLEECARLGVPVLQTYGLTETASQAVTLAPEDALRKLGSAGKPLMPTELRIEHDGLEAASGQPGEIMLRGPNVSPGYHNISQKQHKQHDGWLGTGDVGYLDEEGYLYVLDRRDDLIISGGENIYPTEVEAVLLSHPSVLEAGVTGLPDARWGETVAACVVLREGACTVPEELQAYCREHLAGYKVPSHVEVVVALPRTASGKLMRRVLRERHAAA